MKVLDKKKKIFDKDYFANFLSDLIAKNSLDENKQKEIIDFLQNFNPDKNFVNSLPKYDIRNYNLRYSNIEFIKLCLEILIKNYGIKTDISLNDLKKYFKNNEIISEYKKGKNIKLEVITSKDIYLKGEGSKSFNFLNFVEFGNNYNSIELINEKEVGFCSNTRTNSYNIREDSCESNNNSSSNRDSRSITNKSGKNISWNLNKNNPFKNNSNEIIIRNLITLSNKLNIETKSESLRLRETNKKTTCLNDIRINLSSSSLIKDIKDIKNNNSKMNSNNSNCNSKDIEFSSNNLNITNNSNSFESGVKKDDLNSYKEKVSSRGKSKSARFRLNKLKRFQDIEVYVYKRKLHENLCNINILNKNLMKDCRHNYNYLLNSCKTNFIKSINYQKHYIKPPIEIINLFSKYEILEKMTEIPIINQTESQLLDHQFNKFSIISQSLGLCLNDKKVNVKNMNYLENTNFYENNYFNNSRISDNFKAGIFGKVNNYKGFNVSTLNLNNPYLFNNLNFNDYKNLSKKKNIINNAKSKIQILKLNKIDMSLTNTSNDNSNKKINKRSEYEKLKINNFIKIDENGKNHFYKNDEKLSNKRLININNFLKAENIDSISQNKNKSNENKTNLLGESCINEFFLADKIKKNICSNENKDKIYNFEIKNDYFSLNTLSKRNINIKFDKDSSCNKNYFNNQKDFEDLKNNINYSKDSKAFSFKDEELTVCNKNNEINSLSILNQYPNYKNNLLINNPSFENEKNNKADIEKNERANSNTSILNDQKSAYQDNLFNNIENKILKNGNEIQKNLLTKNSKGENEYPCKIYEKLNSKSNFNLFDLSNECSEKPSLLLNQTNNNNINNNSVVQDSIINDKPACNFDSKNKSLESKIFSKENNIPINDTDKYVSISNNSLLESKSKQINYLNHDINKRFDNKDCETNKDKNCNYSSSN